MIGGEARRAARNAAALAAARLLSSAALFGWQLILGRLLGDSDFGVYGTITGLYAIGASLASFALGLIVIREVARKPEDAGKYLSATLFFQTIFALLAYIGVNAGAYALGYSDDLRALTAIASISLFIDLLGSACYDQLLAQERMVGASGVEIAHILFRILLGVLALAAGFGLLGVYLATLIAGIARSALMGGSLWRTGVRPHFPLDWLIARPLLINALPLALSAIINIAYVQIDRLISTSLLTEADTGHLSAAFVIIVGVVEIISTTVLVALFPLMSRAYQPDGGREQNAQFYFMVEKLAYFALVVGLPIGLLMTAYAPNFTTPLFGADFTPSAQILRVFIWYAVLTMVANVFAQAMMVQNRQGRYVAIRAGGLVVKLVLTVFLLPRIGVIGAPLASVIAEAGVLAILVSGFNLGWRARTGQFVRLALTAVCSLIVMLLLMDSLPLIGIIAGLLIYAGGVLFAGALAGDDYDLLYRVVAALPFGSRVTRVWGRDVKINW
jgi:O-antigen/teichoic acid export membrane protein